MNEIGPIQSSSPLRVHGLERTPSQRTRRRGRTLGDPWDAYASRLPSWVVRSGLDRRTGARILSALDTGAIACRVRLCCRCIARRDVSPTGSMRRILADENVPLPSINALRDQGYQVDAIAEVASGLLDVEVLRKAVQTEATLLTFDRDFGALIFGEQAEPPPCVLHCRFAPESPMDTAERVLALPEAAWNGYTSLMQDRDVIRNRPFSTARPS